MAFIFAVVKIRRKSDCKQSIQRSKLAKCDSSTVQRKSHAACGTAPSMSPRSVALRPAAYALTNCCCNCWLQLLELVMQNVLKSFPSLKAHRATLIYASLALSHTRVYTARPRIWSWCITRCACLRPSFRWYSLRLPTEGWPG